MLRLPAARPTNSARKPTFNQLDFRVDRTWTFKAWQFGVYADLQNIYNAENPEGTIYDYRCRDVDPDPRRAVLSNSRASGGCFEARHRHSNRSPLLALGAGACGELPNESTVQDLRVLGVKCDPAGFLVNLDDPGAATRGGADRDADRAGRRSDRGRSGADGHRRRLPGLHRHDHLGDAAGVEALPARRAPPA